MTRGAAFVAALLATIARPAWWLMALATFLVRGGIVLVLLPIITLPSPLALSNAFAPILLPVALGRIEPAIVAGPVIVVGALLVWLVGGGRIAAAIDAALVREAAAAALDEGLGEPRVAGSPAPTAPGRARSASAVAWRVLAVRLVAWLPLAVALGFGVTRIVEVTYAELTRPGDVGTPLAVRVAGGVVSQLGLIVIAWVVGEVVGGVATRRVVLSDGAHGGSLAWAIRTTAARPLSWLVPWLATTAVLVVGMGTTLAAAALAWTQTVDSLSDRFTDPLLSLVTMLVFVALWLAAMFLGGVILAVRSASQTFEHVRRAAIVRAQPVRPDAVDAPDDPGTFGVSTRARPGDWSADDEGGSL